MANQEEKVRRKSRRMQGAVESSGITTSRERHARYQRDIGGFWRQTAIDDIQVLIVLQGPEGNVPLEAMDQIISEPP